MFVLGAGKSVIATDVLWSDPAPEPGLVENEARGVGLLFGPDVTQVATSTCHCCPCSAMQAMIEACRAKIEQICVRKKYITLFAGLAQVQCKAKLCLGSTFWDACSLLQDGCVCQMELDLNFCNSTGRPLFG